jgi:hopanoid biosynthesis associated protein HpnK
MVMGRRLIVNADDFGLSEPANLAILRAHSEGILTSASLMVAGDAARSAIELARQNPRLGVGLHLTLVRGRAATAPGRIPMLVNSVGNFRDEPVAAGLRYFFDRRIRSELELEVEAQFAAFESTGLKLDHVNGHLNLHLHPVIAPMVLKRLARTPDAGLRLTRDPFRLNLRLASGRWAYRMSHALIFAALSSRLRPGVRALRVRHTRQVFGLLQNGLVDERYVLELLARLPEGDSELYSHPSLDQFTAELNALISPRVRTLIRTGQIELIRYQDI